MDLGCGDRLIGMRLLFGLAVSERNILINPARTPLSGTGRGSILVEGSPVGRPLSFKYVGAPERQEITHRMPNPVAAARGLPVK